MSFELDLEEGKVKVPKEKLMCLQEMLENVKVGEEIPAKILASLIGKIMALSIAVGPVARLMIRSLYSVLNSRKSWFQKLNISQEARELRDSLLEGGPFQITRPEYLAEQLEWFTLMQVGQATWVTQ